MRYVPQQDAYKMSVLGVIMIPRRPKPRLVEFMPLATYFKPAGMPLYSSDEVTLGVDELEAIRLKDCEGLNQDECAARMNLSQSGFQRVLTAGRHKVARALVLGHSIRIEGGSFDLVPPMRVCTDCGANWRAKSRERLNEQAQCPKCGSTAVSSRCPRKAPRRFF